MMFPLGFWDVGLFLGITAIMLLVASELLSPYYGKVNLTLNRRRMKISAYALSLLFLAVVIIRVVNIILE